MFVYKVTEVVSGHENCIMANGISHWHCTSNEPEQDNEFNVDCMLCNSKLHIKQEYLRLKGE